MATNLFTIAYTEKAAEDLQSLRAFDQRKVIDGIDAHLTHEPAKVSRSRIKQMKQPFWCQYRLRVDDFRVYYDVSEETRVVTILRVLEKGREPTTQEGKQ